MSTVEFADAMQRHRKVRSDAVENRERVLAAAREVFAEHGLDALIPEIAARAGVGKGTVYRHFPTKEALIQALLEAYWCDLDALTERALASEDPWEGFISLIRGTISVKDEHRTACDILVATKAERPKPPVISRLREALTTLFRRAQEAGIVRQDIPAESMPLMLHSVSSAAKASRDLNIDWEPYLNVMLDGLRQK